MEKRTSKPFVIMIYVKLTKKFITKNLLPYLSQTHLGRKPKIPLWRIIKGIIHKLKTGAQWREIPVGEFARRILISWKSFFYHFNKWSKDDSWKKLWTTLLKLDRATSVQLDGCHTLVKRGG